MPLHRRGRWMPAALVPALLTFLALPLLTPAPASAAGTVSVIVEGRGSVAGSGIVCDQTGGPACSIYIPDVLPCLPEMPACVPTAGVATLLAGPDTDGYAFNGWLGCPGAADRSCTLYVDSSKVVTARYVDVTAPSQPTVTPSAGVVEGTVTMTASATDNSGTVAQVLLRRAGTVLAADSEAPFEVPLDTTALPDGPHELEVVAVDAAGNESVPAEAGLVVDNLRPDVEIRKGPPRTVRTDGRTAVARFAFGAGEPDVTYDCTLDGRRRECRSRARFSVGPGRHVLRVTATDDAGNRDQTPAVHRWRVVRR